MDDKRSILVLCTGNSARSQMAEGLLRHEFGDRFEIHSAGTKPGKVRQEAIEAMRNIGIDISTHRSKHVDEFTDTEIDYVLTVCDSARENCPYFPAKTKLIHHAFEDPAEAAGDFRHRLSEFKRIRDEIRAFLPGFVAQL